MALAGWTKCCGTVRSWHPTRWRGWSSARWSPTALVTWLTISPRCVWTGAGQRHDCGWRAHGGDIQRLRTCANTLACWLPGEVPEPDKGPNAVAQQLGTWALVDLGKPGDKVAGAVRPDAAAESFDGLQFGVAELVLVGGQADR